MQLVIQIEPVGPNVNDAARVSYRQELDTAAHNLSVVDDIVAPFIRLYRQDTKQDSFLATVLQTAAKVGGISQTRELRSFDIELPVLRGYFTITENGGECSTAYNRFTPTNSQDWHCTHCLQEYIHERAGNAPRAAKVRVVEGALTQQLKCMTCGRVGAVIGKP